jgi:ANTAR domain
VDQGSATWLDSGDSILLRMNDLLRDLQSQAGSDFDLGSTLDELTSSAAQFVPGAAHAGITVSKRAGVIETVAPTDRYPVVLDDIQRSCYEGPCLSAARHSRVVRIDDLSTDDRWPQYSREAVAVTPIRSMLSLHLFAHRPRSASLNLYSEQVNAFGEESANLGLVFAAYTTLIWSMLSRDQQYRRGLSSRDTIGQAKGMLMERFHIDADAAFDLLRRRSQESNTPVITLARRLADPDEPEVRERTT